MAREVVRYNLRLPKEIYTSLAEAINLGLVKAKSINEAVEQLVLERLALIYAVYRLFEEAEKRKAENPDVPDHILQFEIANEVVKDPLIQETFFQAMAETIFAMAPIRSKPHFKEFIQKLSQIFAELEERS